MELLTSLRTRAIDDFYRLSCRSLWKALTKEWPILAASLHCESVE